MSLPSQSVSQSVGRSVSESVSLLEITSHFIRGGLKPFSTYQQLPSCSMLINAVVLCNILGNAIYVVHFLDVESEMSCRYIGVFDAELVSN